MLSALLLLCLSAQQTVSLTVLSTTDLHGNIYPIDYATGQPDERGFAKAATLIRQVRREEPNVLLLDTGDALAGTALAYYQATRTRSAASPVITGLNLLGYDALVAGNHEYDFGWTHLDQARRRSKFPWLAANVYHRGTSKRFFEPHLIKVIGGVRVAILGLATSANPNWEDPDVIYRRIEIRDPLAEAARLVPELRKQADLVILALHMGMEENPASGLRQPGQAEGENLALAIARSVPGIDLMLLGHTHREVPSLVVNGVLIAQPAAWGRSVARVDVQLEAAAGAWRVKSKAARTLPVAGVEADPAVLAAIAPLHLATQRWLDQPVGTSASAWAAGPERFADTAILDFVHRVQLQAGRAKVSLTESLSPSARLPAGPVTVRHLFGFYGVEKKVVTVELTGPQLNAVLEESARYFRAPLPGRPPAEWVDTDYPAYNYYVAHGVNYQLDVSRPAGDRILGLDQNARYRVAMSHYLANGTAGYSMLRGVKVLRRSRFDLRELLVRGWKLWPAAPDGNWALLPH